MHAYYGMSQLVTLFVLQLVSQCGCFSGLDSEFGMPFVDLSMAACEIVGCCHSNSDQVMHFACCRDGKR